MERVLNTSRFASPGEARGSPYLFRGGLRRYETTVNFRPAAAVDVCPDGASGRRFSTRFQAAIMAMMADQGTGQGHIRVRKTRPGVVPWRSSSVHVLRSLLESTVGQITGLRSHGSIIRAASSEAVPR